MLQLDHIAVACGTLEAGRAHVEAALGVQMVAGGRHAVFGTHNLLLGLEDGLYLEVIAVDPDAPPPGRARWFDLDRFSGPPRLSNWICRTGDIAEAPPEAGPPVALERGDLRWRMAVPEDGRLPFDQLFPAVIAWEGMAHPAARLPRSGVRLRRLTLTHPRAAALNAALAGRILDDRVAVAQGAAARLTAEFDTPHGPRVLR